MQESLCPILVVLLSHDSPASWHQNEEPQDVLSDRQVYLIATSCSSEDCAVATYLAEVALASGDFELNGQVDVLPAARLLEIFMRDRAFDDYGVWTEIFRILTVVHRLILVEREIEFPIAPSEDRPCL